MHKLARIAILAAAALVATAGISGAQTSSNDGWRVTVYPVLAWLPTHIGIDVNLPPLDVGGGGSNIDASIVDPRFDGALLAGFAATNDRWRIDADGLWAAVGGDRPERPSVTVDADVIYGHASGGFALLKDFYVTAGVRRLALKYDIKVQGFDDFTRKPGVWDPLVGVGYHREGRTLEVHAVAEGGGFGVGADYDFGGTFRLDWKPVKHFGLTGGYSVLTFKVSHDVASRTLVAKQVLHGPVAGIGLYF
jgi:hypothetical protein